MEAQYNSSLYHEKQLETSRKPIAWFRSFVVSAGFFLANFFFMSIFFERGESFDWITFGVDVFVSTIWGVGFYFLMQMQYKKIRQKVVHALKDEVYFLANTAFFKDVMHNYRGYLFLNTQSLNFKGNYYSKQNLVKILLSDISQVEVKSFLFIKKTLSITQKDGKVWQFTTEQAGIWEEAINEQLSMISSADS